MPVKCVWCVCSAGDHGAVAGGGAGGRRGGGLAAGHVGHVGRHAGRVPAGRAGARGQRARRAVRHAGLARHHRLDGGRPAHLREGRGGHAAPIRRGSSFVHW